MPQKKILKENKPLPSKMFLKAKYDANGKFTKLKARLVAGGHRQKPDTYGRTSSPTVDMSHVLVALSVLNILYGWVATIDVAAAFLHADLKEKIYMRLPMDVARFLKQHDEAFYQEISGGEESVLALLEKSLYGLKQSSHNWNEMMTSYLLKESF